MDYIPFNSRSKLFKNPFSAVRENETIKFRVILPRSLMCSGVVLAVHEDSFEERYYNMRWLSMEGDNEEWWEFEYTPEKAGLYFYHFEYTTPFGRTAIRQNKSGLGLLSGGKHDFQLTVYEKDFCSVDWLKGGIIYQIFPDRFFCSGKEKNGVPDDRILRNDWGSVPYWKPTTEGKVLNNDYFCGDLKGIEQKLSYIKSLGVSCIYLNPIFEAQSNHRYDTSDYEHIDPLLGTEENFKSLCKKAKELGIAIVLDGVFSHTGDDSKYFNKYSRYDTIGAYQSRESNYYGWYKFKNWPDKYDSWWGITILPEVTEESPDFIEYITGKNGIARKWLRLGASGWRLDVADELPDEFLDSFRKAVKEEKSDALILGEVWEDASNKISYGKRRRYLQGRQLDSVMNYPFADAILEFIRSGIVDGFSDKIYTVLENYPKCVVDVLMNHIGTHDTIRAITALAGDKCDNRNREWQSGQKLSEQQFQRGKSLLKLAAVIQYTLPGVPSLYYGDEAGMQGYKDPFNRGCYPWGSENSDLLSFYRELGKIRTECDCLKDGSYNTVSEMLSCLCYERIGDKDEILAIINRNEHEITYNLPEKWRYASCVFGNKTVTESVLLSALDYVILKKEI